MDIFEQQNKKIMELDIKVREIASDVDFKITALNKRVQRQEENTAENK